MTVTGLFDRIEHAAEAVDAMVGAGFAKGELVIVARERVVSEYLNHVEFGSLAQGSDTGAGGGLAIGALSCRVAGWRRDRRRSRGRRRIRSRGAGGSDGIGLKSS